MINLKLFKRWTAILLGIILIIPATVNITYAATPAAPAGVTVTAGSNKVSLTWDSVPDATEYKVYSSTISGVYGTEIATVIGTESNYEVTGLANGITYYFVVKASNGIEDSLNSVEVSATPQMMLIRTLTGLVVSGFGGDGGPATSATINTPARTAIDQDGNIYIADGNNHRIRKIDTNGIITTVAGNGFSTYSGDNGMATNASLHWPQAVSLDNSGNIYIADTWNNRIRKVDTNGIITTIAGNGSAGYSGDNGMATNAQLNSPHAVVVDSIGNVYIADSLNHRIRKVDTDGIITTIAGTGAANYSGDNGLATVAELKSPRGIAVDNNGNIYIADTGNFRIRKIETNGIITTIAGTGAAVESSDNIPAIEAPLKWPTDLAIDLLGNVYIADYDDHKIRKIGTDGIITTIAGTGVGGYNGRDIDPLDAQLKTPLGVKVDQYGNVYIADTGNNIIRKVMPVYKLAYDGNGNTGGSVPASKLYDRNSMTTVANNIGSLVRKGYKLEGWNTKADGTGINYSENDTLIIGNTDITLYAIWSQLPPTYAVSPIKDQILIPKTQGYASGTQETREIEIRNIGTGSLSNISVELINESSANFNITQPLVKTLDDNTPTTTFTLEAENGLPEGVYIATVSITADNLTSNLEFNVTQEITLDEPTVPTIYSVKPGDKQVKFDWSPVTGAIGYKVYKSSESGIYGGEVATVAQEVNTYTMTGLTAGASYYFTVKAIHPDGDSIASNEVMAIPGEAIIKLIAGNGTKGYGGDGAQAVNAEINEPGDITVDKYGNIYIADTRNHRIRKIAVNGIITTIAGTGTAGYGGDNGPAIEAQLNHPYSVAVDEEGNVYIADFSNSRIRKIDTNGIITTIAGTGNFGFGGDGVAIEVNLGTPTGVAVDDNGIIYFTDENSSLVRKIENGYLTRIAGGGNNEGNVVDPATNAKLIMPSSVAVDKDGSLYIMEYYSGRLSRLKDGVLNVIMEGLMGPQGVALDADGNIYAANTNRHRIIKIATDGTTTSIAGTGLVGGYSGDEGIATNAQLHSPQGVAVDKAGNVYIADSSNNRIRKIVVANIVAYNGNGNIEGNPPIDNNFYQEGESFIVADNLDLKKEGYTFKGWNTRADSTGRSFKPNDIIIVGNEALILYAEWEEALSYSIEPITEVTFAPIMEGYTSGTQETKNLEIKKTGTGHIANLQVELSGGNTDSFDITQPLSANLDDHHQITSFTVKAKDDLTEGTYTATIKITADNLTDVEFTIKQEITMYIPPLPNTPTGVKTTAGNGKVILEWNPAAEATGYKIYSSTTSGVYGGEVITVTGEVYEYTITGLENGTTYYFVVKATNITGDSENSSEVSGTPQEIIIPTVPDAPTGVKTTPGNGKVILEWNPAAEATGYKIYSSTTSGVYGGEVITVTGEVHEYTITGLENGTTYYFVVRAINIVGDSEKSSEVSGTPQEIIVPTVPDAPTGVKTTAGDGKVILEWNPVAEATGYKIYSSTTSGVYGGEVTSVTGGVHGYTITGLTNGTTYYFVVRAINIIGDSEKSIEVSGTPQEIIVPTIPDAPTGIKATAGDGKVSLEWNPVAEVTGYKIYSSTTSGVYGGEAVTVTAAVYGYTIAGLTNGTTYYFVVRAAGLTADSEKSIEVSGTPQGTTIPTVPGVPTGVKATAGNGSATVTFTPPLDNGGSPITEYIVISNPGGITATSTKTSVTVTGLANNTAYTFTVTAVNAYGAGEKSAVSNTITPFNSSSGDDSSGGGSTSGGSSISKDSVIENSSNQEVSKETPKTEFEILINGKVIDTAATATNTLEEDMRVASIVLDYKRLQEVLKEAGNNPKLTIDTKNIADKVVISVNGETVKDMELKNGMLEIIIANITYSLPLAQINISNKLKELDSRSQLKDIIVYIKIGDTSQGTKEQIKNSASKYNYHIMVEPVEFEITCSLGEKKVKVSNYSSYVERTIAIPDIKDINKITTGVVVNTDGSFSHVPTRIEKINNEYYVKINSFTNGIYLLISSPYEFSDIENHWAREAINDMGSRLIIGGVGNYRYEPDRDITRAEFAAIIVKALGLKNTTENSIFDDVKESEWYVDYINTAYDYNLILGYTDNTYRPMENITRQEVMIIIERAMRLTGLNEEVENGEIEEILMKFEDGNQIFDWARKSVSTCIKTGIITGRNGNMIAPNENITRAEVAVIIRRLLQNSQLI